MMRSIYTALATIILGLCSVGVLSAEADPEEGKKLFKANCTACHHMEMRLVGPALKNVNQRHEEEWMIRFIKSSQTMIKAGDSAAVALYKTYNEVLMPDQNLSEDQIRSILSYIEQESNATADDNPIPRPEVVQSNAKPLSFGDFRFWIIYTITVVLVIVGVYYKAEMASIETAVAGKSGNRE